MDEKKYGRGMQNSFSDVSDTDYDRAIAETRRSMESCDPCSNDRELGSLISRLNQMKDTYYTVPCFEGYCFGIFTPHKQRISRRVAAFTEERKIHSDDCKDFLREKDKIFERETLLKTKKIELVHEENVEKHRIEAQRAAIEEITTRKTGLHSK